MDLFFLGAHSDRDMVRERVNFFSDTLVFGGDGRRTFPLGHER